MMESHERAAEEDAESLPRELHGGNNGGYFANVTKHGKRNDDVAEMDIEGVGKAMYDFIDTGAYPFVDMGRAPCMSYGELFESGHYENEVWKDSLCPVCTGLYELLMDDGGDIRRFFSEFLHTLPREYLNEFSRAYLRRLRSDESLLFSPRSGADAPAPMDEEGGIRILTHMRNVTATDSHTQLPAVTYCGGAGFESSTLGVAVRRLPTGQLSPMAGITSLGLPHDARRRMVEQVLGL